MNGQLLCLVENLKKNIRCDKCDLPLDLRTWKNKIIALKINNRQQSGFVCVDCILNSKSYRGIHRTKEQLDEFVKKGTP